MWEPRVNSTSTTTTLCTFESRSLLNLNPHNSIDGTELKAKLHARALFVA